MIDLECRSTFEKKDVDYVVKNYPGPGAVDCMGENTKLISLGSDDAVVIEKLYGPLYFYGLKDCCRRA